VTAKAGWYPAPDGTDRDRWWDGVQWGDYATGSRVGRSKANFWLFAGAAAIVVGAFLPWVTLTAPLVGTVTRSGIEWSSDAGVNAAIGACAFAMGVRAAGGLRIWGRIVVVVMAAAVMAATTFHLSDISERVNKVSAQTNLAVASVGFGIWVTIGGVCALILGAASVPKRPKH
jgi:hypothetical protein